MHQFVILLLGKDGKVLLLYVFLFAENTGNTSVEKRDLCFFAFRFLTSRLLHEKSPPGRNLFPAADARLQAIPCHASRR